MAIGDTINAGLMRVDFSPIQRAGEAQARANQAFGQTIGNVLDKFYEKKREKAQQESIADTLVSTFGVNREEANHLSKNKEFIPTFFEQQKAQRDYELQLDKFNLEEEKYKQALETQKDADQLANEERMSENQFMQSLMSQTASPQAQRQADIAMPGLAALGNGDARNRFMQAQLQQPQNQVPVSSLGSQDFGRFASKEGLDPKLSVTRMEALRQAELASQPKAEDMQKLFDNLQKNENELRKEFNSLPEVKDFNKVRTSYDKVVLAGSNPSPAGDISMIFNYMKILDPGSVVREGEFATAQNAGGVDDMVRNQYNRLINGERLNEGQRNDFMNQARFAAEAQFKPVAEQMGRYQAIAKNNNLRIGQVLPDSFLTMGDQLSQKFTTQADEPSKDTMGNSANSNRLASTPAGSPSSKPAQNPKFDSQIQQVLQKSSSGAELTDEEQKIIDLINKRELQSKR